MNKDLQALVHPYLFILQEGRYIKEDMLDYSLQMLHIRCFEVIKAPKKRPLPKPHKKTLPPVTKEATKALAEFQGME